MAVHRHVEFFPKRQITYVQNNYVIHKSTPKASIGMSKNTSILGILTLANFATNYAQDILGMFAGIKHAPAQTMLKPQDTTDLNILKGYYGDKYNIIQREDGEFVATPKGEGNEIKSGDFDTMLKLLEKPPEIKTYSDNNPIITNLYDGAGGDDSIITNDNNGNNDPKVTYGIDSETTENEYTIKRGDTWYSLAQVKYDLPEGVTLKDLATALAKANYNGTDFTAAMKEGIVFMPGDKINLPKELEINGKKVTLKNDWATSDAGFNTNFDSKSKYRSAKVTLIGTKWYITQNGAAINNTRYDTKEEAEAAKKALEDAQ